MELISEECCPDNASEEDEDCLKKIEDLNQINPCITRKEELPEYRVYTQKCYWFEEDEYKVVNSSLADGLGNIIRRPFIKDTTLGNTSFTAITLSNLTEYQSVWYPSDPVYVERNQPDRCKTLKVNYFKSATEVETIYLQYNQTYWTCQEGVASFNYRQRGEMVNSKWKINDPGTWVLTYSSMNSNQYSVYSLTFGNSFQNQFQLCQTDHKGAIDCSVPQLWVNGELSGEDRLAPMHHLRPQCVDIDEIPLKTCSGQVEKDSLPKVLYWGRIQFTLLNSNKYTSNKLCRQDCSIELTVTYTVQKNNEWELSSSSSSRILARSKSLLFDWRGICNDQTDCDSTFPMHSPSLKQPKQCPDLCVAYPLGQTEIELSRVTRLETVYESADLLFNSDVIELTSEGKYEYKPSQEEMSTLFTPLFDATCPNDVKHLLSKSAEFGIIKVNPARLCDNRRLPSDYITKRGINLAPDRVVDMIDFNCREKWPAGCRTLVIPMNPTENSPLMEMHLNLTSGRYTFIDSENTYEFGVEYSDDQYYWALRQNRRIIALAHQPISCPSDAELFFVRKSDEIESIETFSSSVSDFSFLFQLIMSL